MSVFAGATVLRDSLVTIDDVEYANQVRKARFVPDTAVQTYKTLVPDGIIVDADTATWTVELEGVQGNASGGLAKALRDAAGTVVEMVFQPTSGFSKPMVTANVLITAVPFGGEQGSFMDFDVTFSVQGAPVFGTSAAS